MARRISRLFSFQIIGGGVGAGGITLAFVGVGQAQPDWKQLREDIAELLSDDKAKNPSKDEGVQGKSSILKIFELLSILKNLSSNRLG